MNRLVICAACVLGVGGLMGFAEQGQPAKEPAKDQPAKQPTQQPDQKPGQPATPPGQAPAKEGEKDPLAEHPAVDHPSIPKPDANWPKAKPEDVASIEALIKAFYESTAGEPNTPRDWDRFRSLFLPKAQLVATRPGGTRATGATFVSPTEYVEQNKKYFEKGGFVDREVGRRMEEFGAMTHVWSTYESRRSKDDPTPYVRGINSFQILKDGARYWIVNVFWDFEREGVKIPEKYLQPAGK